jgi:hypothetical protein
MIIAESFRQRRVFIRGTITKFRFSPLYFQTFDVHLENNFNSFEKAVVPPRINIDFYVLESHRPAASKKYKVKVDKIA